MGPACLALLLVNAASFLRSHFLGCLFDAASKLGAAARPAGKARRHNAASLKFGDFGLFFESPNKDAPPSVSTLLACVGRIAVAACAQTLGALVQVKAFLPARPQTPTFKSCGGQASVWEERPCVFAGRPFLSRALEAAGDASKATFCSLVEVRLCASPRRSAFRQEAAPLEDTESGVGVIVFAQKRTCFLRLPLRVVPGKSPDQRHGGYASKREEEESCICCALRRPFFLGPWLPFRPSADLPWIQMSGLRST